MADKQFIFQFFHFGNVYGQRRSQENMGLLQQLEFGIELLEGTQIILTKPLCLALLKIQHYFRDELRNQN